MISAGSLSQLLAVVGVGVVDVLVREPGLPQRELERWVDALLAEGACPRLHHKCGGAPQVAAARSLALHEPANFLGTGAQREGGFSRSTHSTRQARQALQQGAEFVLLSPVFSPISKPLDRRPVLGEEVMVRAAAELPGPALALGGISPKRAARLRGQGVHGVAVLGGLWAAPDHVLRARALLSALA